MKKLVVILSILCLNQYAMAETTVLECNFSEYLTDLQYSQLKNPFKIITNDKGLKLRAGRKSLSCEQAPAPVLEQVAAKGYIDAYACGGEDADIYLFRATRTGFTVELMGLAAYSCEYN